MIQPLSINTRIGTTDKFNVRVPKDFHADIMAAANGKILNQWVVDTLDQVAHV